MPGLLCSFYAERLFPQIFLQNCCGLAAAMVAAHHAFPQSCNACIRLTRLFPQILSQNCCGLAAAVGCFGCASPAGPQFLQSTRPVSFLFWLALQSSLCVLLLPSKTRLSRVCWCRSCTRRFQINPSISCISPECFSNKFCTVLFSFSSTLYIS